MREHETEGYAEKVRKRREGKGMGRKIGKEEEEEEAHTT